MAIWRSVVDVTESPLDAEYSGAIIYFFPWFQSDFDFFFFAFFCQWEINVQGYIQPEMQNIESKSRNEYLSFKFPITSSSANMPQSVP